MATDTFWFPATTAADVSPALDAAWTDTDESLYRELAETKGSSALADGTTIDWTTGAKAHEREYVSNPLAAQTISGTVKMQILAREFSGTDNVHALLGIRVVSNDGSTVRGTLLAVAENGPATELNNTMRNKTFADGDALSSVAAQDGDRLSVGIGYTDSAGTTPQATARWGETGTDLPEDETTTTDRPGWIKFSQTILMQGEGSTDPLVLPMDDSIVGGGRLVG